MNILNFLNKHSRIEKIQEFIVLNKEQNIEFWERNGFQELHNLIIILSQSEIKSLGKIIESWNEKEQAILTDCIAYGIDGKFDIKYDDDKRYSIAKLYSHVPYFSHPDLKKWRENYKINSKTKSSNLNILSVYDYLLKNEYVDGDLWSMGGGNEEIQSILNYFNDNDWNELKIDFLNWTEYQQLVIINAIPHGFDNTFPPSSQEKITHQSGNFLLDIFVLLDDFEIRSEISYNSFFINRSNTQQIEKLEFMKEWMVKNGFDNESWKQSIISPLSNIEEAINKINFTN
ncbi:MAG: hypothetical protein J6O88_13635 [Chryseobacterium sp.]|uniref:hypothetical protein n=1 Tax=Chryseobacterium sp. TaxID=1871047 RepID=UPI001B238C5C|nr:hypothetical protein [Chryseobacterium sp.]MBO6185705.1 hypothetical protein [Chryseobacterium sp.]